MIMGNISLMIFVSRLFLLTGSVKLWLMQLTKMLPVLSPVRSCIGMDGARESNADLGPLRTNNFLPKDLFRKQQQALKKAGRREDSVRLQAVHSMRRFRCDNTAMVVSSRNTAAANAVQTSSRSWAAARSSRSPEPRAHNGSG